MKWNDIYEVFSKVNNLFSFIDYVNQDFYRSDVIKANSYTFGTYKVWQDSSVQFNTQFFEGLLRGKARLGVVATKVSKIQFLPLHISPAGDITQNKTTVLQSGEGEKEGKGCPNASFSAGRLLLPQALFPEDC